MKEHDALRIGAFFSRLVDSREYQEVIDTIRKTYIHDYLSSNWEDQTAREAAYLRNQALNDFEATVNSFIALHTRAEQQLEFELMQQEDFEELVRNG